MVRPDRVVGVRGRWPGRAVVPLIRCCFFRRHCLSVSEISLLFSAMILVSVASRWFFCAARNFCSCEGGMTVKAGSVIIWRTGEEDNEYIYI